MTRVASIDDVAAEILAAVPENGAAAAGRRLRTIEAADITEKPVQWTWRRRLVRGALNLLEGEPEAGKSATMIDIIARLSRGGELPDGEICPGPYRILIVGAEDALESVVQPRLRVAEADLSRIRFVTGTLDPDPKRPQRLVLPGDLPLLAMEAADRDLLYVDSSINDLAERTVRPGDDIAVRELLGGVAELAQQIDLCTIVTRHGRKGGSRNPIEYGAGTMGIAAKARAILAVHRDPKDRSTRLLVRTKCNIAPAVPTLRYMFVPSDPMDPEGPLRVQWLGTDPRDAHTILAEIAESYAGRKEDSSRARRALADWLRGGQWKAVRGLRDLADRAQLSWKAIEKAKRELGVLSEHQPGVGWCWKDQYAGTREEER